MSPPMLSLQSDAPSGEIPKATPHLLPCRVHHNGSVGTVRSFWDPKAGKDGTSTAYFRGRKLRGKTVKLPEGYRGVVAAVSPPQEEPAGRPGEPEVVDLEADGTPPRGRVQVQAAFDELVVWAHEAAVDAAADPYVRGAEEWLALAEKIHAHPAPASKT